MKGKSKSKKSAREKLKKEQEAKVVTIPPKMRKRFGPGKMLIPRPLDVDATIRKVRKGKLVTQSQIREKLAKDCGADVSCPITTGIFVRIAAEAAEEDRRAGKKKITPYWRVIRDDGSLIDKLPGGVKAQAKLLRAEKHTIEAGKGKKPPRVINFDRCLARL